MTKCRFIKKKDLQTLNDMCSIINSCYTFDAIQDMAREWVKYYQQQRDMHWQYFRNCHKNNAAMPEGLNFECSLFNPDEYEARIQTIRKLFSLEV